MIFLIFFTIIYGFSALITGVYLVERVKDIHYHPQIIITSFYELLYDENKDVWIYRASRITEKFLNLRFFNSK